MIVEDPKLSEFLKQLNQEEFGKYLITKFEEIKNDREEDRWCDIKNGEEKRVLVKEATVQTYNDVKEIRKDIVQLNRNFINSHKDILELNRNFIDSHREIHKIRSAIEPFIDFNTIRLIFKKWKKSFIGLFSLIIIMLIRMIIILTGK